MKKLFYAIVSGSLLFSLSCKSGGEKMKADEHAETEIHDVNHVEITHLQMDAIGVKIGGFEKKNLSTTVKANGTLHLAPQNHGDISVLMPGVIKEIRVREGDFVQKGQVVASLMSMEFIQLQQGFLEAKNQLSVLEKEFERQKKLHDENISSGKIYQQSEADYRSGKVRMSALQQKLGLLGVNAGDLGDDRIMQSLPLVAPISGFINKLDINNGQAVETGKELAEILDNSRIHADLMVFEKDIFSVKKGQKVIFAVTSLPGKTFSATISNVGPAFLTETKAVQVFAEIDNPKGDLLPGIFVDARIQVDENVVDALPREAIVNEGDLSYIFITEKSKNADGKLRFEKVPVRTGASDGEYVEVVPLVVLMNPKIVTAGAFYLASASKAGEGGDEH